MLTPEEFVEQLLVKALGARAVLVGDNFHFGHRQAGNVAVLAELGRKFGFETEIVPAVSLARARGEQQRHPRVDSRGQGVAGGAPAAAPVRPRRRGGERPRRRLANRPCRR